MSEREVHHTDVVELPVGNDPIDSSNDIARVTGAIGPQHSNVHQSSARCSTSAKVWCHAGRGCLTGNDASHVGSVAELVIRSCRSAGEVNTRDNLTAESRMSGSDTRIHDRHAYALACDASI